MSRREPIAGGILVLAIALVVLFTLAALKRDADCRKVGKIAVFTARDFVCVTP